jgi:hypothetical protein
MRKFIQSYKMGGYMFLYSVIQYIVKAEDIVVSLFDSSMAVRVCRLHNNQTRIIINNLFKETVDAKKRTNGGKRRLCSFYVLFVLCQLFACCIGTNEPDKKTISSKVYGHVMAGGSAYVPWANISLSCGVRGRTRTTADEHGYYLADVDCPLGSIVEAVSWSGPQDICIMPGACKFFKGGGARGSGNISSAGFAKIDLTIY